MSDNPSPSLAQSQVMGVMPLYRCHKEVWALKIKEVRKGPEDQIGSLLIVPEESGYAPFVADREFARKHNPQPGGYYVVYKDGYRSFSPAAAFEEGYTLV